MLLAKLDVIEPLDYPSLMRLVSHCVFVITDSGGLQKEAYSSWKRVLVTMPDTGWRELVDEEWNVLTAGEKLGAIPENPYEDISVNPSAVNAAYLRKR